jgi:homoserine kinase type II
MAVYTEVDDHMLAGFLGGYDVGEAVSFKGIAEGIENSNYLLETTKGKFILTLYERRTDPADLPYFLGMMEHLAQKGLPAPLPISDKAGNALQTLAGRPACMISFLKGLSVTHMGEGHCAELGATLARMHTALKDFSPQRTNQISLQGWSDLFEKTKDHADDVMPGLRALIESELAFLHENWPHDLPTGTIHADLFPDNMLFSGETITGVIDFYFGCSDILAYDLAICINACCFDTNSDFEANKAKRLIEMYDAHRPLTPDEQDALPILCRGAAMRFLLTRLYDWLNPVEGANVSLKDPADFIKRLKFHQQIEDTARYVV